MVGGKGVAGPHAGWRWTEPAPPIAIATAVVKAPACAGSRTRRSAGAVSCLSVRKKWGAPAASLPTGHCADCHDGAPSASDQPESTCSTGDSEESTAILASCTLPRPALRSAELARLTPNRSLRWRSSWRIICIRRTPNGAVSRERGHPVNQRRPSHPSHPSLVGSALLTCLPQVCHGNRHGFGRMQMTRGDTQHCHRLAPQDRRPRRRSWPIPPVRSDLLGESRQAPCGNAAGASYPRLPPPPSQAPCRA